MVRRDKRGSARETPRLRLLAAIPVVAAVPSNPVFILEASTLVLEGDRCLMQLFLRSLFTSIDLNGNLKGAV